ncbi:MAG: SdpI family protein [Clostridia bacterium]|nr:SdpI family protein [Clostridia bacterium]
MIKNNKLKTIVSSVIILLPTIFGVAIWNKIPDEVVTHIGVSGNPDAMGNKALLVFGLPLLLLGIHLLSLWLSGKDPGLKKQPKKAMGIVFWIMPAASVFVSALMYFATLELEFNPMMIVVGFLAFMFISIGNYMPTCKQSATMGIKIKWTLENAENWRATHRFSGKVWFICGLLLLPCVFLPEKYAPVLLISIILPVVALPVLYSYLYYKKQVKQGTYTAEDNVMKEMPKSYKKVSVAALIVLAVVLPVIMFTGNINIVIGEDALDIQADYYNDISISYESIDAVEFREVTADGLRASGFGSMKLLLGKFKNDEFGYYTRYTYADDTGCVVITSGEEKLVIAGKTLVETRAIYEDLTEKIS